MLIEGKNIILETVVEEDAQFIFEMRNNLKKTKYLSSISGNVESQKEWINKYKNREEKKEEFYFIIKSKNNEKLGLVRMYDFIKDSFCWGSWLIKEDAPSYAAIESALNIYEFAFYDLGFKKSHFDVRKQNEKVVSFHKRFGATIIDENELDYFFNFEENVYKDTRKKYKRYL